MGGAKWNAGGFYHRNSADKVGLREDIDVVGCSNQAVIHLVINLYASNDALYYHIHGEHHTKT